MVDAGLQVLGLGLVLVRDHQQAGEDQRAGGQQRERLRRCGGSGAGVRSVAACGDGRLGRGGHRRDSFRGCRCRVRRQTFARPASRPPGTAAPTSRAPAIGWRVPAGVAAKPGRMSRRAGPDRLPLPRARRAPLGAGALAALGVGCTLAASPSAPSSTRGRPVDAGDATLGLLYPLVAALVLEPAARQQGRLAAPWSAPSPAPICWPASTWCCTGPTEGLAAPRSPAGSPPGASSPTT